MAGKDHTGSQVTDERWSLTKKSFDNYKRSIAGASFKEKVSFLRHTQYSGRQTLQRRSQIGSIRRETEGLIQLARAT